MMLLDRTPERPLRAPVGAEHVLFLKWLLLTAVIGFALLGCWRYGLVAQVWTDDPTRITLLIALLFGLAFVTSTFHLFRLSEALNHAAAVEQWVERRDPASLHWSLALDDPHPPRPDGCIIAHLRRLALRSNQSGGRVLDQRALLCAFEASLRRGHGMVWFVADLLLSLGLVGTVIGFIAMLAPLTGLDAGDAAAMKRAIGAMSGGMAVALYTTLAGLVGGLLLRVQGLLLDEAADEIVRRTTELAELHIIPAIHAAAAPGEPRAVPLPGRSGATDAAA